MPEYTPNLGLTKRLPGEKYSRPLDNDNLDIIDNKVAVLDSNRKIPADMLPNSVMEYQGTWNASTNTPAIVNGTGNAGDVYRVSVAGTQNFGSGSLTFSVGDYVLYNGTVWEKSKSSETMPATNVSYNNTVGGTNITTVKDALDTFLLMLENNRFSVTANTSKIIHLPSANQGVFLLVTYGRASDRVHSAHFLFNSDTTADIKTLFAGDRVTLSASGNDITINAISSSFTAAILRLSNSANPTIE